MATKSIRSATKSALLTLLQAHPDLAGVQVEYGWPGDSWEVESVWIASVKGTVSISALSAGRKYRDDVFTITVLIQAGRLGQTALDADLRAEVLYGALEDVLANDPSLGNVDGLLWAQLSSAEGPTTRLTKEGALSMFVADIDCHGRYS